MTTLPSIQECHEHSATVARLERKIAAAIVEYREPMALSDASHSRSTSRRKTKAERAHDHAWLLGLCEGLYGFTEDLTPYAAWQRIEAKGNDAGAR